MKDRVPIQRAGTRRHPAGTRAGTRRHQRRHQRRRPPSPAPAPCRDPHAPAGTQPAPSRLPASSKSVRPGAGFAPGRTPSGKESTPPTQGVNWELTPSTHAAAVGVDLRSTRSRIRAGAELVRDPYPQSLISVTTRAHPSVRALALLLARRIASDILHAQTEIAPAPDAEHGRTGSREQPLLEDIDHARPYPKP